MNANKMKQNWLIYYMNIIIIIKMFFYNKKDINKKDVKKRIKTFGQVNTGPSVQGLSVFCGKTVFFGVSFGCVEEGH